MQLLDNPSLNEVAVLFFFYCRGIQPSTWLPVYYFLSLFYLNEEWILQKVTYKKKKTVFTQNNKTLTLKVARFLLKVTSSEMNSITIYLAGHCLFIQMTKEYANFLEMLRMFKRCIKAQELSL